MTRADVRVDDVKNKTDVHITSKCGVIDRVRWRLLSAQHVFYYCIGITVVLTDIPLDD